MGVRGVVGVLWYGMVCMLLGKEGEEWGKGKGGEKGGKEGKGRGEEIYFWNLSKKSGRVGGCFDVCSCVDGGGGGGGGDLVVDEEEEDEEDENENGVRDEWDEGSVAEDVVDMVDLMEFVWGGGGGGRVGEG